MKAILCLCLCGVAAAADDAPNPKLEEARELKACAQAVLSGFLKIPADRSQRFLGKVSEANALCRGGQKALQFRRTPWVDWSQYWGTGDMSSLPKGYLSKQIPAFRGVTGALLDLEYQRVELIKFNLFDNNGTYRKFVTGDGSTGGPALKVWPEMRLPKQDPNYQAVGGDGAQKCSADLIRARTLSGICNDVFNPLMGSNGTPFARNVEFETTFPDQGQTVLTKNRHGDRLGLMTPDPQVISRKLFTRTQSNSAACNSGFGLPDNSADSNCDYQKAPFFNVLAAYWIQFMTHDWFSHMDDGHNASGSMETGCKTQKVNNVETPLTPEQAKELGCRPEDRVDPTYVSQDAKPETFSSNGKDYLSRAPKTFANNNTAWWDASQLYGYDETSRRRVKRDPQDRAKMLLEPRGGENGPGYLPVLGAGDPFQKQWAGQESVAFPDNWSIGLSFYHNLFAREHNAFVDEFRKESAKKPNADSGLRNPSDPKRTIRNADVTPDELFEEIGRAHV